jgi:hypothetical protein
VPTKSQAHHRCVTPRSLPLFELRHVPNDESGG